jgi:hypothetical protein
MRARNQRRYGDSGADSLRRGTALIVVLVVVVLLSLGAYTFSELMLAETEAASRFVREAQARALADSGVELAAAWLGAPDTESTENVYHNPSLFQSVLLVDHPSDRGRGRVSLVAPVESDSAGQALRYGMIDESSRININAIVGQELEDYVAREFLMYLPDMTEDVADAILDWIDGDDTVREYGVEGEWYLTLVPPYEPRNGPIASIEELLLVSGVTPELLFGEDANRNGLLDPSEDDGEASFPVDNADGLLNPGWAAYLTVHSKESNLRVDGTPKINLNESLLTELYDQLEEEFGTEIATFITAYRLEGSTNLPEIATADNTTGDETTDEALQEAAQGIAGAVFGGSGDPTTRNGMDLSEGASYTFASVYDLLGAEVEVEIDDVPTTLVSPWSTDPGEMVETLPLLVETFSTTDAETIEGRININAARREVLLGITDLPVEAAEAIAAAVPMASDGQGVTDLLSAHTTTGWIFIEGLVDHETLRILDRYLTTGGDVFRVHAVGHYDRGGPLVRVEAVIDRTQSPARVVSFRDLSHLGPGYRVDQLSSAAVP